MEIIIDILQIIGGFLLLVKGGDWLVEGSVTVARKLRLSTMVIGITIIGFGTSAPELLVSASSALSGNSGIAIGNVVGSNIANIALILGVSALISQIPAKRTTLRIDLPFMLLCCLLFIGVAMTGTIERWHGILGILILAAFISYQIYSGRKSETSETQETESPTPHVTGRQLTKAIIMIGVAAAALVYGADILVSGASDIAMISGNALGVKPREMDRIIGLTVVAVGTSLPELFASVMAAKKGETDMAIGNIIGSVTFNILCVIGFSSAICPITGSDGGFVTSYIVMLTCGLLLWLFLWTKALLERWEGAILITLYIAFLAASVVTL